MDADEYSIARCVSVLHRNCQCCLAKRLEYSGIGSGQYGILMELRRRGGIRQEELAEELKTDKGSIAKSVKKLEAAGYVTRRADAADGRAYNVSLTQKAFDILPEVQTALDGWEQSVTADLSEDEKRQLGQLLRRMAGRASCGKTVGGEKI